MPALRGGRELTTTQVAERPSNPGGEPNEIATPRQVGARNDKGAWCWLKETATKSWRRDLQMRVSSLFLAPVAETSPDFSYRLVSAAGHGSPSLRGTRMPKQSGRGMRLPRPFSGARNDTSVGGLAPTRGELGLMNKTTISVHGAFSTGRVPVGRGLRTTPQISLGWSRNKQSNIRV